MSVTSRLLQNSDSEGAFDKNSNIFQFNYLFYYLKVENIHTLIDFLLVMLQTYIILTGNLAVSSQEK